jgi:magnesium transporter
MMMKKKHSGSSRLLQELRRPFRHKRKQPGSAPGTLVHTGEQRVEEVKLSITDYSERHVNLEKHVALDELKPYLEDPSITWIHVQGLHDIEYVKTIGNYFNLHPLVMEDILNTSQRPKFETYDDYLFFVVRIMHQNEDEDQIHTEQLSMVLGPNYLLTFQETDRSLFNNIHNRLQVEGSRIRTGGIDYLAYAVLDNVVDYYFSIFEYLGDRIEDLEDELLEDPKPSTHHRIHGQRKELIAMRKAIWPLRDMLNSILRDQTPQFKDSTLIYIRDIYDHVVLLIDTAENNRDIIMGMFDTYMSSISNRMNEIMKVLTIIATIFIPLSFVVGLYGMNFNTELSPYNMPELNSYYGYPIVVGVMVTMTLVMLGYFRYRDWI